MKIHNNTNSCKKSSLLNHTCKDNVDFSHYIEKAFEKQSIDFQLKSESENTEKTSIFHKKKIGKRQSDIFDTLIDI
ncbi:MAG: hypothetical protein COA66_07735 [Arcobacter sp.]|nr:MAG: hypothetical protein COA66_07735 [Arcobacter sp.]